MLDIFQLPDTLDENGVNKSNNDLERVRKAAKKDGDSKFNKRKKIPKEALDSAYVCRAHSFNSQFQF